VPRQRPKTGSVQGRRTTEKDPRRVRTADLQELESGRENRRKPSMSRSSGPLERGHQSGAKGASGAAGVSLLSRKITIRVNSTLHDFEVGRDVEASHTLAYLLREKLGLTGLKVACDEGACGACTVLMDGQPVLSCMTLAVEANGHDILTIEGLGEDDPLVEAFAEQCEPTYGTALQCGFCTPGFVMTAKALLRDNPHPTLEEVQEALSGNLCRCGCYSAIAQAVLRAAEKMDHQTGQ
jgi:carbon-monoxide dehydrogenase small subunit